MSIEDRIAQAIPGLDEDGIVQAVYECLMRSSSRDVFVALESRLTAVGYDPSILATHVWMAKAEAKAKRDYERPF